jgi:phenylacetate-CoA ligase
MDLNAYIRRNLYWTNDYLKGSPIRNQYNDVRVITENYEQGQKLRQIYLHNMLKHATTHSSFYQQYDAESLQEFPIVNKAVLLSNYDAIKISPIFIPNQQGVLHIQRTSGSTGIPFAIPQDTRKRNRRIAELKYFGEIVGFRSHEKLIHLRTWNRWQNKSKLQSFKENIIAFDISHLTENKLKELCHIIIAKNIVALRGYASSIDLFIRYVIRNNIKLPSLKIIIAGSETLLDSTRHLVQQYIGCKIISQYANEENGILAQESILTQGEEKQFYLNHASYFFEILKLNSNEPAKYGELGRIIVTDIFNYAFPMIRYDTGDTGIIAEKDEYSNGYPVFSKLYGRKLDLIYDTKNNPVHPMAIGRILKNYPDIIQWQFIQQHSIKYVLKLNILKREKTNNCIEQIQFLLGQDAKITVEYVKDIPVMSSGKRKAVVNEWKS